VRENKRQRRDENKESKRMGKDYGRKKETS